MKKTFYSEIAYILGLILIAIGVVFMEKANFGVSMIVAPAYILYRWINPMWSVFSFGMAEYTLQAVLILCVIVILRRFKLSYLLSFATAVVYGFILDGLMWMGQFLPTGEPWYNFIYFILGILIGPAGVSMMFHTYISPEAYELFVKEISKNFKWNINKFKTIYDCSSCVIAIIMSILIFGVHNFVGVNWGTIVCAVLNGTIIAFYSRVYEKHWIFKDAFTWRPFFVDIEDEKEEENKEQKDLEKSLV